VELVKCGDHHGINILIIDHGHGIESYILRASRISYGFRPCCISIADVMRRCIWHFFSKKRRMVGAYNASTDEA
jgi:hypothetical protein